MRMIPDCSVASLHPFVVDCVEPGSVIHADGWQGYTGLEKKGCQREIAKVDKNREEASELMPRLSGRLAFEALAAGYTPRRAACYYLPYYLDEFAFRFNWRKSKSRGKLFFRLMQQAHHAAQNL
jgi:hypothetical protein